MILHLRYNNNIYKAISIADFTGHIHPDKHMKISASDQIQTTFSAVKSGAFSVPERMTRNLSRPWYKP